jgi:5'-nucleotidase (lipoprotein e(P4) family)
MRSKHVILGLALAAASAVSTYFVAGSMAQQSSPLQSTANNTYQIGAILYQQKAGEYRALAYQAYNIARLRLDEDLDKKHVRMLPKAERKRPRAIFVDIDETVLDNSAANAYLAKNNIPFNEKDWYAWGEERKAKAVPGAVDFLNYAVSKGVKVFFASNRDDVQEQATIDNLRAVGFKDISPDNVMLRVNKVSTKEPRRTAVSAKYRIVLLMGDNLDDFSGIFENKSLAERFAEVDKARDLFGKGFIVLPNAMYGTWESAIYNYQRLTDEQKAQQRINSLELP